MNLLKNFSHLLFNYDSKFLKYNTLLCRNKIYDYFDWITHILIATLIFMAVCLANGRPSVFPDTAWYYSQGEYLAHRLGIESGRLVEDQYADPTSVMLASQAMQTRIPATVAGGRSPFYGLALVLTVKAGTLWVLAAIQSFLAAWVINLIIRNTLSAPTVKEFYIIISILSLLTSLAFFTSFAMPDIFAGFVIISIVLIIFYSNSISLLIKICLWTLLTAGISFHAANILIAIMLSAIAFFVLIILKTPKQVITERAAWVAGAIVVALLSNWGFAVAYQADVGIPQRAPPFLMARLIADGPGRDYLAAACPGGASPTLCRFAKRPMVTEDEILWSERPNRGVFNVSDYETRTLLKNEEPAFVLAVIARSPLATLTNAVSNGFIQLGEFFVLEPLRNPASFIKLGWWRRTAIEHIVPGMRVCEQDPDACQARADGVLLAVIHTTVILGSICAIAYYLVRFYQSGTFAEAKKPEREDLRLLLSAYIVMGSGVLLNAFICGAISGHFPRYQARIIWIVPLIALLMKFQYSRLKKIIFPTQKTI